MDMENKILEVLNNAVTELRKIEVEAKQNGNENANFASDILGGVRLLRREFEKAIGI